MPSLDRIPNHSNGLALTFKYDEAAAALGRSTSWLQKQVAANAVPHRRLGRSVVFTREDLDEILRQSYRAPATSPSARSRRTRPAA